jgi:hypothetical protein
VIGPAELIEKPEQVRDDRSADDVGDGSQARLRVCRPDRSLVDISRPLPTRYSPTARQSW